jgi:hypothetical protein
MGLPFKNGFELAQALGFGKLYQASKEHNENNVQMESKESNQNLIRLTEEDLHNIVKESVNKILNEYGSPEQLGAIAARRRLRCKDSNEVHNYATKKGARNSSYYKGYVGYMQSHPDEMVKYARDKFHNKDK